MPSLCAATSPDADSGQFTGPAGREGTSDTLKPTKLPKGADDRAQRRKLWIASEQLTGVSFNP